MTWRFAIACLAFLACDPSFGLADEPKDAAVSPDALLAHWRLAEDGKDSSGRGHHAENQGVRFDDSQMTKAARFNGRDAYLSIPAHKDLTLGQRDFTLSLWVHTDELLDDDLGDLISQYDPANRTGFHLSLRCNTGVTSSQANYRQLQFGIDQGSEPVWTDEGRPGQAILAFAMTVHHGQLYAGTCEPGPGQSGRVYRHAGPNQWVDCGAPDSSNSVSALAAHQGRLYAGTAKYRLGGSALTESENTDLGGRVFRYEGEKRWVDCGQLPNTEAVAGLTVFRGKLYASSLYRPAGFFRYEGGQSWTALPTPDGKRVDALGVFNGYLWATGYDEGHVYRFDGERWEDFGGLDENTQTYSFAIHQGRLCVGTWNSGKVYRLTNDRSWKDMGQLGEELEVMGMLVHNGALYAGTLPLGQVYRYDGVGSAESANTRNWSLVKRLDQTPDVKYRRVWTMAQYQGKLFCSTLPSGHVYAMEAGKCVTYDRELAPGWRHLAAVRDRDRLKLYVDGELAAESTPFEPNRFDLQTPNQPLKIGAGSGDFLNGRLSNARLHARALTAEEIARMAATRP